MESKEKPAEPVVEEVSDRPVLAMTKNDRDLAYCRFAKGLSLDRNKYFVHSTTDELYREYVFLPDMHVYKIAFPIVLIIRAGGTTHRIIDSEGITHCVPFRPGVVVRWNSETTNKCRF